MHFRALTLFFILCAFYADVPAQPLFQTVRGTVKNNQTKETLPGASVSIPDSVAVYATTTDNNGAFRFQKVSVGRHRVRVSYLGFNTIEIMIEVTSGKETVLNIELEEKVFVQTEAVVSANKNKDKPNNEMATVSARSFTTEETSRYAGSLLDPARMAMNYAGVSGANDARNDIIIRGNSPLGLLWRLNGIEIPNPNHFGSLGVTGGPISILNNNTLDKSDFFTGGFPAEYGNAMSGVFDLQMRTGNNEQHEFLGQVGFNGLEFGAEGPFKKGKASYLFNYRYSTLKIFHAANIDLGTGNAQPDYQDITFNINIPQKHGRLTLFGIAGKSYAEVLDADADTSKENIYDNNMRQNGYYGTRMGIAGLQKVFIFNNSGYAKVSLSASSAGQNYIIDSIGTNDKSVNPWYRNNTNQQKFALNAVFNKKFSTKDYLKAGIITDYIVFLYSDSILRNQTVFQTVTNSEGHSMLTQAFVQWQHKFSDRFTIVPGLHSQHFALNNTFTIEPRIGFKALLNRNQAIGFGAGLYSQLQPMYAYFQQTALPGPNYIKTNTNMVMSSSLHVLMSYDKSFAKDLRLKTEVYYQYLFHIPVESHPSTWSMLNDGADFVLSARDSLINEGTGENYGVEFTLEKFFSKGYYYLFTTSLFQSVYYASDGLKRNTAFNGNYVVNALAGKEWVIRKKNVFEINFRQVLSGGKRYIPVDLEASQLAGHEVKDYSKAFVPKYKDYLRTDIKIAYRLNRKKTTHEFALNVDNIFNRKNIWQQYYDVYSNSIKTEYQIGIFPVPLYRLTF